MSNINYKPPWETPPNHPTQCRPTYKPR